MISRLQPHASSMEAGSIRKPYQNLISISGKQNFNSEYHYMVFDGFWISALSGLHGGQGPGEGRMHFWNLRNDNPYHSWDRFAPHSWCIADSHIPFASLLSRYAPQVVIWRGYAGRLIIPKGFSNPPALYRQDYHSWGFKSAFYLLPAPGLHGGHLRLKFRHHQRPCNDIHY